jgi:hypothetical protein
MVGLTIARRNTAMKSPSKARDYVVERKTEEDLDRLQEFRSAKRLDAT